ncbi:nuclear transport factor 2 family protein [Arthrobacter sp. I2-34]|uniref:Nuclear transport factor 2 family protein n=1 Tax=Arthrobacter hankyongi TaxID=2904801 RepID=A0ABS9L436_9MICC|nr:nuclear transport factor 2 family protein [Arthrobacter hankyongi]MCG2621254.1 nuclear transport factor 2 family protein [Arthrobacter hankyongi]
MDTVELAAREGIRDLVARYSRLGDSGQLDGLLDLFVEDAVLEFVGKGRPVVHTGRPAIRAAFEQFRADFAARAPGGRPARIYHSVTSHVIDVVDGDHATGDAYVSVIGHQGLLEWGSYQDRYIRTSDGWRFAARRARLDAAADRRL